MKNKGFMITLIFSLCCFGSISGLYAQASSTQPGLYVGESFQGKWGLLDALDWITLNVQNGGVYTIVLGSDQKANNISLDYGNKQVTVILKASDGEYTVKYDRNNPSDPLFTIGKGVTFSLEAGVTLSGRVSIQQYGTFTMNGGSITGSDGVYVAGTFTMNGGSITGNTSRNWGYGGGGVAVQYGAFTMNGGSISNNTATSGGGGVYVGSGTFTMNGGSITGNTASGGGGGVYVEWSGTFTKSEGIIYGSNAPAGQTNKAPSDEKGQAVFVDGDRYKRRNTTADETTVMDSKKLPIEDGSGWE